MRLESFQNILWNQRNRRFEIRLHRDICPQCALDDCQNFPLHTWSLKGCVREIRTRCNNKNLAKLGMLCLWWCPNLADLPCLSDFNCFLNTFFLPLYFFFQAWISGLKSWFVGILIDMFASKTTQWIENLYYVEFIFFIPSILDTVNVIL